MKNAGDHAQRLKQLLRQLGKQVSVPETPQREPVEQLVYAFLVWESSRRQADQAFPKLMKATVDLNELRVSDPAEIVEVLGSKYPRAEERARRLKQTLNSIYVREHAVDLAALKARPKREARAYLEELNGAVPFVVASVCLFSLNAHAIPVDEQLHQRLRRDRIVPEDATLAQAQSFLEHHVRAGEAREAFHQLRAYVERPIKAELDGKAGGTTKKTAAKSASGTTSRRKKATTSKKKGSGGRASRASGTRRSGTKGTTGRGRTAGKSARGGSSGSSGSRRK